MATKILKGLAIAAGTGIAVGFSASFGRRGKSSPDTDLEELRLHLQSQAREIAVLERRFANAGTELASMIEAAVAPRVEELRDRMRSEMREAAASGLARVHQAIDEKLEGRIATLKATLSDQSGALVQLNERAIETDASLQKLIAAVERLCDRADPRTPPGPLAEPTFLDLPFQKEYEAALQSEPAIPPRMFVPAFHPSAVREA